MIKFSKKHKDQLIGGLITAFLLLVTLIIKHFFFINSDTKPSLKDTTSHVIQSPTINAISKDSSKQTVNQVPQVNSNKGDVNNEFVSGDKKTYNIYNQSKNKNKDTTIVNKGNLSLNNQGTVTQNTYYVSKPPPRIINQDDKQKIISFIPSKDYQVVIQYLSNCLECTDFANQILNYLNSSGYIATTKGYLINMTDGDQTERIQLIAPNPNEMKRTIFISTQRP